jgi:GDP-L-fucose synthase
LIQKRIYIAGINGMAGKAIKDELLNSGFNHDNILGHSSAELDLRDYKLTKEFLKREKPEAVIIAAAKVGGILANINNPVTFLQDNLEIQTSLIRACHELNINNVIFLSSSCVYPRDSIQPMKEEFILTGKLEPTNENYALAKLSGMKLIEAYRNQYNRNYMSLIPCNLYGIYDNFDPESSHVVAGLIRKFTYAKNNNLPSVTIWGTGNAMRELMFSKDLAKAVVHFLNHQSPSAYINIGTGKDISISDLAYKIAKLVEYSGSIEFDSTKPDGMPRKVLDVSIANNLGWKSLTSLDEGLANTIKWYRDNHQN